MIQEKINDILNYLEKLGINASDDIVQKLLTILHPIQLKQNDFLVKQDDFQTNFFIVKSGIIRSFYLDENGREITRELYTAGHISGNNAAMIKNEPSLMYYQALTNTKIYKGDYIKLKDFTKQCHKISLLYTKIIEFAFLKTEKHVIRLISLNSTEQYLNLRKKIPNVDNILAQKHIASYLNITPVQLSRIKKKIATENKPI